MNLERYVSEVGRGLERAGWTTQEIKAEHHAIFHAFHKGVRAERCICLMDLFHVPVTLVARRQGAA